MKKNYIKDLQTERFELREHIRAVMDRITDIEIYLSSSKFAGTESDYVHVSTDMLPKIRALRENLALVAYIETAGNKES